MPTIADYLTRAGNREFKQLRGPSFAVSLEVERREGHNRKEQVTLAGLKGSDKRLNRPGTDLEISKLIEDFLTEGVRASWR